MLFERVWSWRPARICFTVRLRRRCRCPGLRCVTLPVPVILKRFDIPLCVFFIVIGKLEKSGKNNRFRLLRQAKCLFYIQS